MGWGAPHGQITLIGREGLGRCPTACCPTPGDDRELDSSLVGSPQKARCPLTLRSIASDLGRSKQRAAREQKAQPCRRRPRLHLHRPLMGSSSPPPAVSPPPWGYLGAISGGNSRPGRAGRAARPAGSPETVGRRGTVGGGVPAPTPKAPRLGVCPLPVSPPKKVPARTETVPGEKAQPAPCPCPHDERLFSITGGILWDGVGHRIVTACPPAPVTPQRVTAPPAGCRTGGIWGSRGTLGTRLRSPWPAYGPNLRTSPGPPLNEAD